MSGDKDIGNQPRDTASEDTFLEALYHTHRETTLLFLMTVGEGTTDSQIVDSLRQHLSHLNDPVCLPDRRTGKQPMDTGTTEKDNQSAAQTKRTRTSRQAPTTQPALLTADLFTVVLGTIPTEDWCRTWAAAMTIMLRRTSKRVKKEVVDKVLLSTVVRLSKSFWSDAHNGTEKKKCQFVLRQLSVMTVRCR
jgi:hypothetical protein